MEIAIFWKILLGILFLLWLAVIFLTKPLRNDNQDYCDKLGRIERRRPEDKM